MRFNNKISGIFKNISYNDPKIKTSPEVIGISTISPGDLVVFNYKLKDKETGKITNGQRLSLVVSNDRGQGFFISTRHNLLMSTFKLDDADHAVNAIILKNLYKNRAKCNYYRIIDSLSVILGSDSYRTYNVAKTGNVHQVYIDKNNIIE